MMKPAFRADAVACPCCNNLLYATMESPAGSGIFVAHKDSPKLEHDDKGPFMKCPQCSQRIGLREIHGGNSGFPLLLDLDDDQPCNCLVR